MIASLRGQVRAVRGDSVVLDVGGVGYAVYVPASLLERLSVGTLAELQTHMVVRETAISLYGFGTLEEREIFVTLLSVSGVGPRTALSTLSSFSPELLRNAIAQGDATALARVPGLGRKMAQRLVLDLREKIGVSGGGGIASPLSTVDTDVLNALTSLGYSIVEAQDAVRALPEEAQDLDQRILAALRFLGGR
ncbi:MAG: Holliday junction branch migration protein RuvA [Anaerolineae bacterium]